MDKKLNKIIASKSDEELISFFEYSLYEGNISVNYNENSVFTLFVKEFKNRNISIVDHVNVEDFVNKDEDISSILIKTQDNSFFQKNEFLFIIFLLTLYKFNFKLSRISNLVKLIPVTISFFILLLFSVFFFNFYDISSFNESNIFYNYLPAFISGEWWRIFTSIFIINIEFGLWSLIGLLVLFVFLFFFLALFELSTSTVDFLIKIFGVIVIANIISVFYYTLFSNELIYKYFSCFNFLLFLFLYPFSIFSLCLINFIIHIGSLRKFYLYLKSNMNRFDVSFFIGYSIFLFFGSIILLIIELFKSFFITKDYSFISSSNLLEFFIIVFLGIIVLSIMHYILVIKPFSNKYKQGYSLLLIIIVISFYSYSSVSLKHITTFYDGKRFELNKDYNNAIEAYTKAIEMYPYFFNSYHSRALIYYFNLKDYKASFFDFDKLINFNPDDNNLKSNYFFYRAFSRGELKDSIINVINDYTKAIEINPDFKEAYFNRSIEKSNLGNYKEAAQDYTKVIEIDPDNEDAYYNRGSLKFEHGYYKEAIADLTKAIKVNPNDASNYYLRGASKRELKLFKETIQDFTKCIEIEPLYIHAYLNRGYAFNELKYYKGAMKDYTKAIEMNPNLGLAYYYRGETKLLLKDTNGACLDFSKATELGDKDAYKMLIKFCN